MSPIQSETKILIEQPTEETLNKLNVKSWPIWSKEPSTFDWHYDDQETCYLLEGDVEVRTSEGTIHFGKGDLVTFPKGLDCTWKINQSVRKHYQFGT